jgi:hypothetical protein
MKAKVCLERGIQVLFGYIEKTSFGDERKLSNLNTPSPF